MRNKILVQRKVDELENIVKRLDNMYKGAATPYEREQVYLTVREKIEEISTLINTEFEE